MLSFDDQSLPRDEISFPQPLEGESDAAQRRHKLHMLLRGRYHWAILLAVALGLLGGTLGYLKVKPEYLSAAQVQIDANPDVIVTDLWDRALGRQFDTYMNGQITLISSARVLRLASQDSRWAQVAGAVDELGSIAMLRQGLDVRHERKSEYLTIYYAGPDPKTAVAGVNSILAAYIKVHSDEETDSTTMNELFRLQDQQSRNISNIQQQKAELLQTFGTDMELERTYTAANEQLRRLEQTLSALILAQAGGAELNPLLAVDTKLQAMIQARDAKQDEVTFLKIQKMGENHYTMKRTRAELAILENNIKHYVASGGNLVPNSPEDFENHKNAIARQIEQQKRFALDLAMKVNQLNELKQTALMAQNDLHEINARIKSLNSEASVRLQGRLANTSEGDEPIEPHNGNKRIQVAGLGGVAGVGLGFGVIMLIGLCDHKLRHAEDAEYCVPKARMLGILPSLPKNLTDPQQAALAAHAVHHIRTLLQIDQEPDASGRVFSITGAAAGTGKTSLTVALGLSFAASNSRTLLIDCDIVAGGLTRRLEAIVRPELGSILMSQGLLSKEQLDKITQSGNSSNGRLAEALIKTGYVNAQQVDRAEQLRQEAAVGLLDACGNEDFDNCIAHTDIRNLSVLPIGSAMPHQAGALSPNALRRIIAVARKRYDVILIDTGPVLGSLEASIAATAADGTIMVVSRGDHKTMAFKSLEHLRSINARIAGMVFNHALDEDMARTSYAVTSMAQSRRSEGIAPLKVIDQDKSLRYGPLASAVASYGGVEPIIGEDDVQDGKNSAA